MNKFELDRGTQNVLPERTTMKDISKESQLRIYRARCERRREHFLLALQISRILTDNKLCKNSAIEGQLELPLFTWDSIDLTIREVDLPTIIDHVAGPFHRAYGVDWKLEIPYEGKLTLRTTVKQSGFYFLVVIGIFEGSMQSCEIQRVIKRQKTQEEINAALTHAAEVYEYELRIDCTGE
ncbi:MAG: hypothetical protein PHV42_04320 [Candidatus Pacebacteria bacterium]|nr:hypothetical protein [Candidatus Paceibacterota bacterium]